MLGIKISINTKKEVAVGIGVSCPIFSLLILLIKSPNSTYALLYSICDFTAEYQVPIILVGIISLLVFLILTQLWSVDKRPKIMHWTLVALAIVGFFVIAGGLLFPSLEIVRWGNESVALVQEQVGGYLDTSITNHLTILGSKSKTTINISKQVNTRGRDGLRAALENVKTQEHDIVILDYYAPFDFIDGPKIDKLLNPRTLYILTRPLPPGKMPKLSNILSVAPSIIDEVIAITNAIPNEPERVEIYRSDDRTGEAAEDLFRSMFSAESSRIKRTGTTSELNSLNFDSPVVIVWLDWEQAPSGVLNLFSQNTLTVIAGSHAQMEKGAITPQHLPLLGVQFKEGVSQMEANQAAAINIILTAHFTGGRPLDLYITLANTDDLMREHLGYFTKDRELVYRYADLKLQGDRL